MEVKRKRKRFPQSTTCMGFRIIWPGSSNVFCNKYLEEFKIGLVKRYFSGTTGKYI